MGQYILLSALISSMGIVAVFLLSSIFDDQTGAISIVIVLIFFLSIIVTQLMRIIELLKNK